MIINEDLLVHEMQLLTGIMTSDKSYMVYKILEGGSYCSEEEDFTEDIDHINDTHVVSKFDDWFNSLGG